MEINDKVLILDCGNKYPEYNLNGKIATIINVYGLIDPNYALKVKDVKNMASKDGLFYLKQRYLAEIPNIPLGVPVLRCMNADIISQAFKNTISIKKVIFNKPATIVIWNDGTKTVVKRQKGDRWNKELGLAMCIIKKLSGNTGRYYELFKRYCNE